MRRTNGIFIFALCSKQSGKLGLDEFNELFKRTCPSSVWSDFENSKIMEARRLLQASAICEIDYGKRKIELCEAGFVILPTLGTIKAVLIGARDISLIEKIKLAAREGNSIFSEIGQKSSTLDMPNLIVVECLNIKSLEKLSQKCLIPLVSTTPTAWQLAHVSSSVNDVVSKLKFIYKSDPNGYNKEVYSPDTLGFSSKQIQNGQLLARYQHTERIYEKVFWLWDNGQAAEIELDWGRWAALEDENLIYYDEETFKLAIPASIPLPKLLDRTLVLCSGLIPNEITRPNHNIKPELKYLKYYAYHDIPQKIAEIVALKLNQKIKCGKITNRSIEVV